MAYQVDPWYKSKRVIASIVLVVSMLVSFMGYSISEADQTVITDSLMAISGAVAAILIVWSKVRESSKIIEEKEELDKADKEEK